MGIYGISGGLGKGQLALISQKNPKKLSTGGRPFPISLLLLVLVTVGRKLCGDVAVRAQADGRAVEQCHRHRLPEYGRTLPDELAGLQTQGLRQKLLREATAGVAIRPGGGGTEVPRQLAVEPLGSAGAGVGDDGLKGVISVEPLKEQIPEGDQRGEEALVEGQRLERGQPQEGAAREEQEKEAQELSRGEGEGRARGGGVVGDGVFFSSLTYAYDVICIHIC